MSANDLLVLFASGLLLILASVSSYKIVTMLGKKWLISAFVPYANKGIVAGETLALDALKIADTKITGADKSAIANSIYDAIPDWVSIPMFPIQIHVSLVKLFVSEKDFESLIDRLFTETDKFIRDQQDYIIRQVNAISVLNPKG